MRLWRLFDSFSLVGLLFDASELACNQRRCVVSVVLITGYNSRLNFPDQIYPLDIGLCCARAVVLSPNSLAWYFSPQDGRVSSRLALTLSFYYMYRHLSRVNLSFLPVFGKFVSSARFSLRVIGPQPHRFSCSLDFVFPPFLLLLYTRSQPPKWMLLVWKNLRLSGHLLFSKPNCPKSIHSNDLQIVHIGE